MGIFQRIGDILSANLNELMESYENPEKMLKQAVREMDAAIADATQQTAKAMANQKTVARELDRNRLQASQWEDRATKAVLAGDDDLARKALIRKGEHDKMVAALDDECGAATLAVQSLQRQLDAMKAKQAEAKRQLATLTARKRAADFSQQASRTAGQVSVETSNNAFAKFDRLKSRVEQAEAEAEALAELQGNSALGAEWEADGESTPEVASELAELKRKLGK